MNVTFYDIDWKKEETLCSWEHRKTKDRILKLRRDHLEEKHTRPLDNHIISEEKSIQTQGHEDHKGLCIPTPAPEYFISYFNAVDKADSFSMVSVDRDEAGHWKQKYKVWSINFVLST